MNNRHHLQLIAGGAARSPAREGSDPLKFSAFLNVPAFDVPPNTKDTVGATRSANGALDGATDAIWSSACPPRELITSREPSEECSLAQLWANLVAGRVRVVDHFDTDEHIYLVLEKKQSGAELTRRQSDVLTRILLGESQKVVAIDLSLSPSAVASTAAEALRRMGWAARVSRVPAVFAMAAHAHGGHTRFERSRCTKFFRGSRVYSAFRVERPDAVLSAILAPSECAVARLLVEGKSYSEIAMHRSTSLRTVANQLSATFRRLRVSGRSELLSVLIRGWEERGRAPRPNALAVRTWPARTMLARGVV